MDSRWEERAQDSPIRCIDVRSVTKNGTGAERESREEPKSGKTDRSYILASESGRGNNE